MTYQLESEDHKKLFDIIAKEDGEYSLHHAVFVMIRMGQQFSIFPTLVKKPQSIFSETNEEKQANIDALKKQNELMEEHYKNDFKDYPSLPLNNDFMDYMKKRNRQTTIKFLTYLKTKTPVSPWSIVLSTLVTQSTKADHTRDYEKEYKKLLGAFIWAIENKEYVPNETEEINNLFKLTERLTGHEEKYLEKDTLILLLSLSALTDKKAMKSLVIDFIRNHKTISTKNLELYQQFREVWKKEDLLTNTYMCRNEIKNFINERMLSIEKKLIDPHYYYILDMNELARELEHNTKIVKRNFSLIGQVIDDKLHKELLKETYLVEYKYHRQQGILKIHPRSETIINLIEDVLEVTKSVTKNKQEIFLSDAEKIWEQCKLKIYLQNNLNESEKKPPKFKI